MADDAAREHLAADLVALGRTAPAPGTADVERFVAGVTSRVDTLPPPPARRRRGFGISARHDAPKRPRLRWVAAVVAALLLALLGVPPVRAAVSEWFGFAGVRVRLGAPVATGTGTATPVVPPATGSLTLQEARSRVGFPLGAPSALGVPQRLEVSADGRTVSLSWTLPDVGVVRLDEFDGRLDFLVAKTAPEVTPTLVGEAPALWFDEPHEVIVDAPDGTPRTTAPRLAGRTLIWQAGVTTCRLEGALTLERAVAIALSVRPSR